MAKLVGITGKAGVGKSTMAEVLRDEAGYHVVSLADKMKRICRDVFGFTDEQLWGPSAERNKVDPRWGFSPRTALQKLGTDWARALHEDVWVRGCVAATANLPLVVIPDVRFDNEARMIHEAGGKVLLIERDVPSIGTHASEAGVSRHLVDLIIDNNGPKAEIANRLRAVGLL